MEIKFTFSYYLLLKLSSVVAHDSSETQKAIAVNLSPNPIDPIRWVTSGMTAEYRFMMFSDSIKRVKTLLGMHEGGIILRFNLFL